MRKREEISTLTLHFHADRYVRGISLSSFLCLCPSSSSAAAADWMVTRSRVTCQLRCSQNRYESQCGNNEQTNKENPRKWPIASTFLFVNEEIEIKQQQQKKTTAKKKKRRND